MKQTQYRQQEHSGVIMRKDVRSLLIGIAVFVIVVLLIAHIQKSENERRDSNYAKSFSVGEQIGMEHAADGDFDCDFIFNCGLDGSSYDTDALYRGYISGCSSKFELGIENAYQCGVESDDAYEYWYEYFVV
ncbi:MAG: hypothetical protein ACI4RH_04460, partial [Huintestinicola sp.]